MNILGILPQQARDKYLSLEYAQSAAHAALKAAQGRLSEAIEHRDRIEQSIRHALDNYPSRSIPADERERIEAPLKPASDAVVIARKAADRSTADYRAYDFMHGVSDWLKRAKQFGLKLKHSPLPAVPSGDPIALVASIRSELLALADQRIAVEEAAVPAADLKRALADEINMLASKGSPRLELRSRGLSPINVRSALTAAVAPGGKSIADNAAVFLIWLLRDQLLNSLGSLIDTHTPEQPLTDAEQDAAINKIDNRIAELEWQEEAIITIAASRGQIIPRRREVDPRIFLEVAEK